MVRNHNDRKKNNKINLSDIYDEIPITSVKNPMKPTPTVQNKAANLITKVIRDAKIRKAGETIETYNKRQARNEKEKENRRLKTSETKDFVIFKNKEMVERLTQLNKDEEKEKDKDLESALKKFGTKK